MARSTAKRAKKVSISLGPDELRWALAQARRKKSSLSAVMQEALRSQCQAEARARVLEQLGGVDDISDDDVRRTYREWTE